MPLFEIQDDDRPMYVVAGSWRDALEAWENHCKFEYPGIVENGETRPLGIRHVVDDHQILLDVESVEVEELGKILGVAYGQKA